MENDSFNDPADMQNFLARYREARSKQPSSSPTSPAQTSSAPPLSPRKIPTRPQGAMGIWGSVFHPLGKSPTSANRYDLSPGQTSTPGMSASEVHAKGTGISLDARNDDM